MPLDEQGLDGVLESGAGGRREDADGAGLDPAVADLAGRGGDGRALPVHGVQLRVQVRLASYLRDDRPARARGREAFAGVRALHRPLTVVAAWGPDDLIGTSIAGPSWLRALLPLLIGAPLLLRRRAPLLMWAAIWAAIALQSPFTLDPQHVLRYGRAPETPEPFIFALFVGAYSLGAHASLRRAAAGLLAAALVVTGLWHNGGLGLAFLSDSGGPGVALSVLQLTAFWLAGVFVRSRGQAAALAARSAALQRQAEHAAAAERARIARELHDIVAHHLSVVVLHAAGARAAGGADPQTLAEIEQSGRQALTETRRLFGVLRDPGAEASARLRP